MDGGSIIFMGLHLTAQWRTNQLKATIPHPALIMPLCIIINGGFGSVLFSISNMGLFRY
jgi:hypothetical protein